MELSSLIQEVAVDGNFEAQAKDCAVKVDSVGACTATSAREQLRRAIENVMRNAIQYTHPPAPTWKSRCVGNVRLLFPGS